MLSLVILSNFERISLQVTREDVLRTLQAGFSRLHNAPHLESLFITIPPRYETKFLETTNTRLQWAILHGLIYGKCPHPSLVSLTLNDPTPDFDDLYQMARSLS